MSIANRVAARFLRAEQEQQGQQQQSQQQEQAMPKSNTGRQMVDKLMEELQEAINNNAEGSALKEIIGKLEKALV